MHLQIWKNTEMDQMDTGEETECNKYIRVSMPLPDIPSL